MSTPSPEFSSPGTGIYAHHVSAGSYFNMTIATSNDGDDIVMTRDDDDAAADDDACSDGLSNI